MGKRQFSIRDDFRIAAALGMVGDVRTLNFSGARESLTNGVTNDLVNFGGPEYVFPNDAGEAMELISDNAGDVSLTYIVDGLLADGTRQIEEVADINGTTATATVNEFRRINLITNSGAVPSLGSVDIRAAGAGQIFARAEVGPQRSQNGVYTTPADETAVAVTMIPTINKSSGSDAGVVFRVCIRAEGGVFTCPVELGLQRSGSTIIGLENQVPDAIPPLTDIKLQASPDAAGIDGGARLGLILFKGVGQCHTPRTT